MRIALITPPMVQVNTPYPATAYLSGFLKQNGISAEQYDFSLALALKIFCRSGLTRIYETLLSRYAKPSAAPVKTVRHFLKNYPRYLNLIDLVVPFLQGKDGALAHPLSSLETYPQGARFESYHQLRQLSPDSTDWVFGVHGTADRAKHFSSLFLDDIIDVVRDGIDSRFEFARYGEKLAASAPTFDPMAAALGGEKTLIDQFLDELVDDVFSDPGEKWIVAITVPFPGNLYGALRIARRVKAINKQSTVVLGGGYVNTELRQTTEVRLFESVDYLTYDEGYLPLLRIIETLNSKGGARQLIRTRHLAEQQVVYQEGKSERLPFAETGTPTYRGLPLSDYLSLCELLNPMHRLWSDGRWNKLTLAHGCYWRKCTFCDISLDYISRYEPQTVERICEQIQTLISETGQRGFHFVDEAAPPALLDRLSDQLIERNLTISWWTNIRFEKHFTPELAAKMARAGCIAVTGGLEAASDRLLAKMQKGVTVDQVAQVTHAFASAGILVHAYLIFGFPTQTLQETIDSLDRVRQLFVHGCLQSAFWHRFSATVHSPVGMSPNEFGIRIEGSKNSSFANNDLAFIDPIGVDPDTLASGLKKAVYNYLLGIGLEEDLSFWFERPIPKPKVSPRWAERAINQAALRVNRRNS